MKKLRFSETQIVSIIKRYENGEKAVDLCREYGISQPTFYNWKQKYAGMEIRELTRMKDLERENARLKKMYADVSLQRDILKEVLGKK